MSTDVHSGEDAREACDSGRDEGRDVVWELSGVSGLSSVAKPPAMPEKEKFENYNYFAVKADISVPSMNIIGSSTLYLAYLAIKLTLIFLHLHILSYNLT